MIDPDTIGPGDWLKTPDGLSVLLVVHRPNVFREDGVPGDVYGPTDKVGLAYKTFCGCDGRPVSAARQEGYAAPLLCDPIGSTGQTQVQTARAAHPEAWAAFRDIATSSLHQPCQFNLAHGLGEDDAEIARRVARVTPYLAFPPGGITLNALSLSLADAGVVFDYASAARAVNAPIRANLILGNVGFAQNAAGENLFFTARIATGVKP